MTWVPRIPGAGERLRCGVPVQGFEVSEGFRCGVLGTGASGNRLRNVREITGKVDRTASARMAGTKIAILSSYGAIRLV